MMKMAENYFPIELAAMIQSEYKRGISSSLNDCPCHDLVSGREGSCSISTSVNFATPQHVDICDGSIRIFSWVHIGKPITAEYFVLSNLQVTIEGQEYN